MQKLKYASAVLLLMFALGIALGKTDQERKPAATEAGIAVYFSPDGGCTEAIVNEITAAKKTIKIQAYRLTSKPIAEAIRDAHRRGVSVSIILDEAQQSTKYSDATFYSNEGMAVLIDPKHAIAHNKTMLIDDATIITGSFNFSGAAEKSNAENLLVIKDKPELMKAYSANFNEHAKHAVAYQPPGK